MPIHVCMSVANGECFGGGVGICRAKARMATFDSYFALCCYVGMFVF